LLADAASSTRLPTMSMLSDVAIPKTELYFIASCSDLLPSQHLAVIGSIEELGCWDVQRSLLMETHTERLPNWSAKVLVNTGQIVEYKYIVVVVGKQGEKTLIRWEELEGNRKLIATGVRLTVNDGEIGRQAEHLAVNVDPGWIANNYQLRLFFGSRDPARSKEPKFHFYNASGQRGQQDQHVKYRPYIVPINKLHYLPGSNPCREGTVYTFVAPRLEDLGVNIIIWEYKEKSRRRVGKAVLIWQELTSLIGEITRPIFNDQGKHVGEMHLHFVVVTPFKHPENNLKNITFYQWKPHVNVIGHRGFGASNRTFVTENTLLSFNTAHQFGIRYVEFDVQLTRDKVPVIFHDFTMEVSRNLHIKVPIASLTLKQFKQISRELHIEYDAV